MDFSQSKPDKHHGQRACGIAHHSKDIHQHFRNLDLKKRERESDRHCIKSRIENRLDSRTERHLPFPDFVIITVPLHEEDAEAPNQDIENHIQNGSIENPSLSINGGYDGISHGLPIIGDVGEGQNKLIDVLRLALNIEQLGDNI